MSTIKMFSRYQMVDFGNYLLSKERRELYKQEGNQDLLEERLSVVNHADIENYISVLEEGTKNLEIGMGF